MPVRSHPAQLCLDFGSACGAPPGMPAGGTGVARPALAPALPRVPRGATRAGPRGERWVEHRMLPGGPVRQWVVMPPMAERGGALSHHARRAVLVEFLRGGIWLFRAPLRYGWPADQLEAAAAACEAHAGEPRLGLEALRYRLAGIVEAVLDVHQPRLGAEPQDEWQVDLCVMTRLVSASLQAASSGGALPPGPLAIRRASAAARRQLAACLADFRAALPATLTGLASRDGAITGKAYNLLAAANPDIARNRRQFSATFPLLFEGLLGQPPDPGVPRSLLADVDRGRALVPLLARAYGVHRHTIRHLVGKPLAHFGTAWSGRSAALLQLLDSLPPELRPEQAAPWQVVNALLASAREEQLGNTAPELARTWLQHHRTAPDQAWSADALAASVREIALVNECRAALSECLHVRARASAGDSAERHRCADALARDLWQGRSWSQVLQLARAWHRARMAATPELQLETDILGGRRYAGLLPQSALYGRRRIVPLVTAGELALEGQALQHCVGSYARLCREGTSHIVSLRDPLTGQAHSTAEFRLDRHRLGHVRLILRQHHARQDRPPAPECREAVAALLADAGTAALQAWWHPLLARQAQARQLGRNGQRELASILLPEAAFRAVLRPAGCYDQLVARLSAG